jgi:uncharacterized repeat protein (TIGR02543 family)
MNVEMSGSLLSVSGNNAWRGGELTNGFLMRNADGRVAAITQSGIIDLTGNAVALNAVPFGNGLIRVLGDVDTESNLLKSGAAGNSVYQFAGVVKYEPGWAISHPVQNWGIPAFSKFTAITRGIVGYKFSQKTAQPNADYLAFLKGDKSKVTAIDTYQDWMDALAAAAVIGSNLYLLISVITGFPKVVVGGPDKHTVVIPAGHMLVAQAVVFEPENGMIGFEIDGDISYGAAGEAEADVYSVTYSGNSNSGGAVPVDTNTYLPGAPITVAANSGALVRAGYSFGGWNTAANGSGITYDPADVVAMGAADIILHAVWIAEHTVTYDDNDSTGGTVPVDGLTYGAGDTVTVLTNSGTLARTNFTFSGWNTLANGTGITYPAGSEFVMGAANVTLYALWVAE